MRRLRDQPLPAAAEVHAAVRPFAEANGLRLAVLFGSAATGAGRPQDIDIALLGDGPLDLVEFTNLLTPILRTQDVDLVDLRGADPLLMALVARDGRVIYEATPGEFDRFASLAVRRFADGARFREAERQFIADFIRENQAS